MEGGGKTPFWRALLAVRSEAAWGNFSWLSLRALLESVNDSVTKGIDRSIVNRRRMRWVAAQRERGIDPWQRVRLPKATKLLCLGDPGEMDASQYVLVRELRAARPDVLLLMSDVVYPGGHVDAWSDAVYLPYFGLPESAWSEAVAAAGLCPRCDSELETPAWKVFASPGNHDWYDGLTGFMYHACGAEPLPFVPYSTSGRGLRATVARRLWQSPPRWDRERAHPLRAEAARRAGVAEAPGPMPFQPGPYYSIEIGGRAKDEHGQLRVICLDTGIDGSIDVEQAEWLAREVSTPGVQKVLVTGKPLIVDDEIGDFPVDGGGRRRASQPRHPAVREILAEESCGVVAWLAGDIHNAQRIEPAAGAGSVTVVDDGVRRVREIAVGDDNAGELPPLALISGGGGAFLSATHYVPLTADGSLELKASGSAPAETTEASVPAAGHWRFPSREVSIARFAKRVGWKLGTALLGTVVVAAALVILFASLADRAPSDVVVGDASLPTWHVVGGAAATLLLTLAAIALGMRGWRGWRTVLAAAPLVAVAVAIWTVDLRDGALLGAASLLALLTPVALIVAVQLRAFPTLSRWLPKKRLAAVAASTLYAAAKGFEGLEVSALAGITVAAIGATALIGWGAGWLSAQSERSAAEGRPALGRVLIAVGGLAVAGGVVGAYLLVGRLDTGVATAIRMVVVADGILVALALIGVGVFASWNARQVAPLLLGALSGVLALGGPVAALVLVFEADWSWLAAAALGAGALLSVVAAVAIALVVGSRQAPSEEEIEAGLKARDGVAASAGRGVGVFHAMTVAAFPGIAQIAEATQPPFSKSYLTIELVEGGIEFATYGVDDERAPVDDPPRPIDVVRIVPAVAAEVVATSGAEREPAGALSKASVD